MGSSTIVLLALVCRLAVAQDDMFQDRLQTTLTPMPTATPVPPNPPNPVVNQTFLLPEKDNASIVCLHMMVAISMNITYYSSEDKQNASMPIALTGNSAVDRDMSTCNSTAKYAKLVVALNEEDTANMGELYMAFEFKGNKDSWSLGGMNLTFDTSLLDGYDVFDGSLTFNTDDRLNDTANENIEYTRFFKCDSDQTLHFNENKTKVFPTVLVSELRVQAFDFNNKTSGAFDNARTCLLDTAGKANKIVPIAVGAALAGLVVVVLIAYLIGRLRSRRQSSYEALS